MTGENDNQDVFCGSPSSDALSAGLPLRSKTYQRPSPLRQMLHTSSKKVASTPETFRKHVQHRSKSTTDVPDTSVAISSGGMSNDTVYSTSQSNERLRSGEIRLLRLFPSEFNGSSIDGSLAVFTLMAAPAHTAISYAWGDRRSMSSIHIDGEATSVTTSLLDALMAVRKRDEPTWIWVDALSINQRDVDELNSQVHIMDTIYSQADTVAMCLGSQCHDSEQAFKTMNSLTGIRSRDNILDLMLLGEQGKMLSVVRLFERNYWKRLWVMQEIFHAKRATVYCGPDYMALDAIFLACDFFKHHSGTIENWFPAGKTTQTPENHYSYAQMLTTQGPNTLLHSSTGLPHDTLEILRICRSKLTARPQDKVLGVLSLLPQDIRMMFQPDFHLTPLEVFTEIVICMIRTSRILDVICESIRYPFHQNSFSLPSWVPDWSHCPDTLSLTAAHLSNRRPFQACSKFERSTKPPLFSRDELQISGIQIGSITARGMAVGTLGRLSNYLMAFLEWRHLLHDDKYYTRSHAGAFCRTLCLGDIPEDVYPTLNRQYDLKGPPEDLVEEESSDADFRQMDHWRRATFDLFAQFLGDRLGKLPLDEELQSHQQKGRKFRRGRQFLQDYFGDRMMGRCFCLIEGDDDNRYMGMGTGYMGVDDLVVIAYGCSTPIVIRPTDQEGKYEFIGDIYVDGCMDEELSHLQSEKTTFVLR